MKKVLLAVAMFTASVAVMNAQEESANSYKPDAGSFSVEVGFSPVAFDGGASQLLELQGGLFRINYSVTENIGVRLGLSYEREGDSYDNGESGAALLKTKTSQSTFEILPGVTYSFEGTSRLTPYVGLELVIGTSSNKVVTESPDKVTTKNVGGDLFNTFGFHLLTGFDYYFVKNLYVGVELGAGYEHKTLKKVSIDPKPTGLPEDKTKTTESVFGFGIYPSLRLGWAF